MFVDYLIHYRISLWPKTAEKRGFCTGVTDGPSYRDAFLTDASKKRKVSQKERKTDRRTVRKKRFEKRKK